MFEVKDLDFKYDLNSSKLVLKNINMKIKSSGIFGINGHSGTGKSTLLYTLAGFKIDNWSGSITYDSIEYKYLNQDKLNELRKNKFSFIFQKPFLISYLTVMDNILSVVNSYDYVDTATSFMERLGVLEYKDSKTSELSGGEQQRVAMARALIHDPKVIFADEPTASLDFDNAINVMELLKELSKDKLIFVVSHDSRLFKYFDKLYTLVDGSITDNGLFRM